jgi:hypothetical protein
VCASSSSSVPAGTIGTFAGTESAFVRRCRHEDATLNDTRIRNTNLAERDHKLTD